MINFKFCLICILATFYAKSAVAQEIESDPMSFKCNVKVTKVCLDTIVGLTQYVNDTAELKMQIRNLQQPVSTLYDSVEKLDPAIDRFLNLEDISIFSSKYMELSENDIHPRSISYYLLIKNIRSLESLLSNINYTTIRDDLDRIGGVIDEINNSEKSPKNYLPLPLMEYYKSLVKKYGDIYIQIYPNE